MRVQSCFYLTALLIGLLFSKTLTASIKLHLVTEHFPPYQTIDENNHISGLTVDTMRQLMDASGYNYSISMVPWARAFQLTQNEPNTIIFSMVRNQERENKFIWLGALRDTQYFLYGLESRFSQPFDSLKQAKKYSVVATRDSYEAKKLLELGYKEGKNLILITRHSEIWPFIRKGRADLVMTSSTTGLQLKGAKALLPVEDKITLWAATNRKTDPQVVATLTRLLSEIPE